MKLNPKSQLALRLTNQSVNQIFDIQYDRFISTHPEVELKDKAVRLWAELFSEEFSSMSRIMNMLPEGTSLKRMKNKNYLMAEPALDLLKKIKIDEDKFDIRFLSKIPDKKITFLLGNDLMIRYAKEGDIIFAVRMNTKLMPLVGEHLNYTSFLIDISKKEISYIANPSAPLTDPNFIFFLQLLIFTELSTLEIKVLKPKEKTNGTRKEGKYVNDSGKTVIIVDSTWNKMIVRAGGFTVSPHLRLQACGKDWLDRKLVLIDEFEKSGYIRKPKKETTI